MVAPPCDFAGNHLHTLNSTEFRGPCVACDSQLHEAVNRATREKATLPWRCPHGGLFSAAGSRSWCWRWRGWPWWELGGPRGGCLPALASPSGSSGALRRLQQHLAWGGTGQEAARGKLAIAPSRRSQGSPLEVWVGPPLRGVLSLESGVGEQWGWVEAPSKITPGRRLTWGEEVGAGAG